MVWRRLHTEYEVEKFIMNDPVNSETAPVKTTNEARQGVTGHNVRYVLLWGVGGVVLVFAIAGLLFFRT